MENDYLDDQSLKQSGSLKISFLKLFELITLAAALILLGVGYYTKYQYGEVMKAFGILGLAPEIIGVVMLALTVLSCLGRRSEIFLLLYLLATFVLGLLIVGLGVSVSSLLNKLLV